MDYITAGDANGQALVALVQGIPAGLRLIGSQVESDLHRCLQGYGAPAGAYRYVEIESGLCGCTTSGAPVAFLVYGDDASSDEGGAAEGCVGEAGASLAGEAPFAIPRPGRGDLAAVLKTAADAVETVTTRLDAYDQAACVVAASVPREFLAQLGVEISSFVSGIGSACMSSSSARGGGYSALDVEFSPVRCPDKHVSDEMVACIEQAQAQGKTLGGTFQVVATGVLPGLGDYAQRSRRLNARLAAALFSLPDVVAVAFGDGHELACEQGPDCHDAVLASASQGFSRASNHAGGLEDGLTSGEPLLMSVSVAPCAPTRAGQDSVDFDTLQFVRAASEHAPTCVVPGVAVAAEAEVAFVLANAYLEQFGDANMADIGSAVAAYADRLKRAAR